MNQESGKAGSRNAECGMRNAELEQPIFQIGEPVYSAIAPDERGMVITVTRNADGFSYQVVWASEINACSNHHAIELSREPLYQQPTR